MVGFVLILVTLFCSVPHSEQVKSNVVINSELTETDSIYLKAIEEYIVELAVESSLENNILYIRDDEYLWDLPDSLCGFKLEYVGSLDHLAEILKKSKEEVNYIEVSSLYIRDGSFFVYVQKSSAFLEKKKKLFIDLSDWVIVKYEFVNKKLVYQSTKTGGI